MVRAGNAKEVSVAGVGTDVRRVDGADKVTGRARYAVDLRVAGMWWGVAVRSPHAHARILRIDTSAFDSLGDATVVTARDLGERNVVALIDHDWPVLAADVVRHVGEAVALVAAPTLERARQLAAAVRVEYEPLDPIVGLDAALARGSRVLAEVSIDHGDVDAAFAAARASGAHLVEATYSTGYQEHIYIEPQAMLAQWHDDGRLEVVGSLQCPYYVHRALRELFDLPQGAVRVRQAVTGGGFGGKEDYPNLIAAHAALLARTCGRPVFVAYDRHEDIVATTKRHPSRVTHRTAVASDGTLLAMDVEVLLDGGAYTTLSPVVLSRAVIHAAGPYRCDAVRIRGRVLATHTPPNGAFRGFGAPQVAFAVERHMDAVARAVGLDPLTLRRRNAYREGDVTPTGQRLERSVSALECLEEAARRTNFLERWREAERARGEDNGPIRRGIGISLYWHGAGFTGNGEHKMRARAAVQLRDDARIEVLAASTEIGQGTQTVFRQMAASAAGIDVTQVCVREPDTAAVPDSGPTVASRTVMVVGGVVASAARRLAATLRAAVAERAGLEASQVRVEPTGGGRFVGPDGAVLETWERAARRWLATHGELVVEEAYEPPDGNAFDEKHYRGTAYAAYGWGCDVAEVEVDLDTLQVRPVRVTAVCDVGKAIHPVLCRGQVEGGTLQAVGWAVLEELEVTADGHYRNDRLQTYLVPTALDSPAIDAVLVENPAPGAPWGAKGVGELPMDGGAPAVVGAVENATGLVLRDIPLTPSRLHRAWVEARRAAAGRVASASPHGGE